jgi:hypothetical protein
MVKNPLVECEVHLPMVLKSIGDSPCQLASFLSLRVSQLKRRREASFFLGVQMERVEYKGWFIEFDEISAGSL